MNDHGMRKSSIGGVNLVVHVFQLRIENRLQSWIRWLDLTDPQHKVVTLNSNVMDSTQNMTMYRLALPNAFASISFTYFVIAPLACAFFLIMAFPIETLGSTALQQEDPVVSRSLLPTGNLINPVGKTTEIYGRPNDLALSANGKWLLVKDWKSLRVIDAQSMDLLQTVDCPGGASLHGMAVSESGTVFVSNAKQEVHVYENSADENANVPEFKLTRSIKLPNGSFPCGIELSDDQSSAFVCLSRKNSLAVVDIASGELMKTIDVGIAPFDVELGAEDRLYVSNIGGRQPITSDKTAPSAGTETVVDNRGIASSGTVSVVSVESMEVVKTIDVGRHPSVLLPLKGSVFVCNTNEDSVSEIKKDGSPQEIVVKPDSKLPFGTMPSSLAASSDGKRLFVALAGNNAIGVFDQTRTGAETIALIPTGWYPVSVVCNEKYLYVANVKGVGARSIRRPDEEGRNSHDHRGSIQQIPLADLDSKTKRLKWTQQVLENGHVPQILRSILGAKTNASEAAAPKPVPDKLGEPGTFKHVIYVIKENRTYDQVFGDIEGSRGEPSLCVFPEKVTPNHHALAKRFGVLDNYYCNGVLSADGHSWATEGNVTPYLERAFGGFARSYTFGDDPITYSSSGFIWDRFLDAGLSFRNYGELNYSKPPEGMKYQAIYEAYRNGEKTEFSNNIGIKRLRDYSCLEYPGWNMQIPDVIRMKRFINEFREFEKNGALPNLAIVYLPQDHLGGGVTSNAHMADNDLALGQLVEAVSNSRFWEDTVIFVNEDDPQNGYDHIDGHRSICLVISAYSKPGINHTFYNQTSVLRTMLHMFGLVPLNQKDSAMPLMSDCFVNEKVNRDPYKCIAANFPLNEVPKSKNEQSAIEKKWRKVLATVPIERTGMKTEKDEDNLNRFVWHEVKGWTTPFPEAQTGAHGTGLGSLGLQIDPDAQED